MISRERVVRSDWMTLTDGEEIRWVGRPSIYTIASQLVVAVALILVGLVATPALEVFATETVSQLPRWVRLLPLLLVAVGVASAALTYLRWIRLLYVITSEEVYVKRGLVSRDVTQIRLSRVQNTTFEQSMVERALSFGDVAIYTAGTDTMDVVLKAVPNPEQVNAIITGLLSEEDRGRR